MRPVFGLTGGIGSGKSTAASLLAQLGASVVDADDIARALTAAGGDALTAIREAFGEAFAPPGQAMDRAAMRRLVFSDPTARSRLEAILHPRVREALATAISEARGSYTLLVVPLLFESGSYLHSISRAVVVDCCVGLQVERTMVRSRISETEVRAIIRAQWPRWRRLQAADEVLWNGGGLDVLGRQCEALHHRLCRVAACAASG